MGTTVKNLPKVSYGVVLAIIAAPFLLRFIVHAVRYANAKDARTIAPWPWLLQFLNGCTVSAVFFATRTRDMTYLTFDKTAHQAHAVLIIETPHGQRYGNWSYMQGRFMVPWDVWVHQPNLKCPH